MCAGINGLEELKASVSDEVVSCVEDSSREQSYLHDEASVSIRLLQGELA